MAVERTHKSYQKESLVVGFSDEDYAGVKLLQTNALVVTLQVPTTKSTEYSWIMEVRPIFYIGRHLEI